MIARIIIKNIDGNATGVIEKNTKRYSLSGSKEDFVEHIIKQNGVWDDGGIYFYPYHTIKKIEFRKE